MSNRHRAAGSSLNRFGQSVWKKNSKVLNSVPPTMKRKRRRNRFFVVRSASGAPAISNCGCARMPNWMLALEFSTRSGVGGGANGTYGLASVAAHTGGGAGGVVSAASAGASGSADFAGLAGLASSPNSSSTPASARTRADPGADSATTTSAAKPGLRRVFCLLLRSRSLIACLPSASSPVVDRGPPRRFPPVRARSPRPGPRPTLQAHPGRWQRSRRWSRLIRSPCLRPRRPG